MTSEGIGRNNRLLDFWGSVGITKHVGGIAATKQLAGLCGIGPSQLVLDIGCGTGYTACFLAKEYDVKVIAIDINPKILRHAKKRIERENVSDKVITINADANNLPFPDNMFDAAISESVLTFCDKKRAPSEIYRVLKPDGYFGGNEGVYLKPPPHRISHRMDTEFSIQMLDEMEWHEVFESAGFAYQFSRVFDKNLIEDIGGLLKIYGVGKFCSAFMKTILNPSARKMFSDRDALKIGMMNSTSLGYGLYVYRKLNSSGLFSRPAAPMAVLEAKPLFRTKTGQRKAL
ncbi:hypothetical protein CUJ83_00840 [Methanocella sp. CWC-04]|uniref:Methyltransferase type 11 domain-containing protein n=1 Tax=Methanooceanicella nereidis TaxID=2052831 RepID=A0AAP2RAN8_9EURY|nr:class I SAM-dependent methyltransferase [Methanocella sp. CWC-04]MCD1293542.1 hypothetical protein [Methanocella sp. CWC-04]